MGEGSYITLFSPSDVTAFHRIQFVFSALITGSLVILFALFINRIDDTLYTVTLTLISLMTGPQAGIFFLGLLFPWVDWLVSMALHCTILLCKAKMHYLLTCRVSRYRLLASYDSSFVCFNIVIIMCKIHCL